MIVCVSCQECHSRSSLDQSDRKSEWKYNAIKYTVGIQASAHLKQSQKKKKVLNKIKIKINTQPIQNSPGIFLTVALHRNELTTKVHAKNELNSKYTRGGL